MVNKIILKLIQINKKQYLVFIDRVEKKFFTVNFESFIKRIGVSKNDPFLVLERKIKELIKQSGSELSGLKNKLSEIGVKIENIIPVNKYVSEWFKNLR